MDEFLNQITSAFSDTDIDLTTIVTYLEKGYGYVEKAFDWISDSGIIGKIPGYLEKAIEIIGKGVEFIIGLISK